MTNIPTTRSTPGVPPLTDVTGPPVRPPGGPPVAINPSGKDDYDHEFNMRIGDKVLLCRVLIERVALIRGEDEVKSWAVITPSVGAQKIQYELEQAGFKLLTALQQGFLEGSGVTLKGEPLVVACPTGRTSFELVSDLQRFFLEFGREQARLMKAPVAVPSLAEQLASEAFSLLDKIYDISTTRPKQVEGVKSTIRNAIEFTIRNPGKPPTNNAPAQVAWSEEKASELQVLLQGVLPLSQRPTKYVQLFDRLRAFFDFHRQSLLP